METNAKLKFRIKVEEKNNGQKRYYPQASTYKIGLIPKRYWFGIAVKKGIYEEFDIKKDYKTIIANMGVDKIEYANRIISIWKPKLERSIKSRIKKTYFVKPKFLK